LGLEILRGGEEKGRVDREPGNGRHVLLEINRKLLREQHRGDGIGRDIPYHQRVAVRLGPGHLLDRENAERARFTLDHKLLAKALTHLLPEEACRDVARAPGSVGHDDLHRPRWIFILRRDGDAARREAYQRQSQTEASHRILPLNVLALPPGSAARPYQ